jgi:hypothetical protein
VEYRLPPHTDPPAIYCFTLKQKRRESLLEQRCQMRPMRSTMAIACSPPGRRRFASLIDRSRVDDPDQLSHSLNSFQSATGVADPGA